jgi:hypothetical protein
LGFRDIEVGHAAVWSFVSSYLRATLQVSPYDHLVDLACEIETGIAMINLIHLGLAILDLRLLLNLE